MKYIVELVEVDGNLIHNVYFKRWFFSKKKLIGTIENGGILAVKDQIVKPHFLTNFVRYDFVNTVKPEFSKNNCQFL